MSLRVSRAMPPTPRCAGPSRVRMALKVSGEWRTTTGIRKPSLEFHPPLGIEKVSCIWELLTPPTCSQSTLPNERPPDFS